MALRRQRGAPEHAGDRDDRSNCCRPSIALMPFAARRPPQSGSPDCETAARATRRKTRIRWQGAQPTPNGTSPACDAFVGCHHHSHRQQRVERLARQACAQRGKQSKASRPLDRARPRQRATSSRAPDIASRATNPSDAPEAIRNLLKPITRSDSRTGHSHHRDHGVERCALFTGAFLPGTISPRRRSSAQFASPARLIDHPQCTSARGPLFRRSSELRLLAVVRPAITKSRYRRTARACRPSIRTRAVRLPQVVEPP